MEIFLANYTNNILRIINLLNKCPMYTTDKKGDSQTLSNDEKFKSILKDVVKYNRDRTCIYLNINNIHLKTEILEDISKDPLPTLGPTSVSVNRNHVTCQVTQPLSINLPQNVVTYIENISKSI